MNKAEVVKRLNIEVRKFLLENEYKFDKKNLDYKYYVSDTIFFHIHFDPITTAISGKLGFKIDTYITLFNLDIDDVFKKISKRYQLIKRDFQPLLTSDIGTLMANQDLEKKVVNNAHYIEVYEEEDFSKNHEKFKLMFDQHIFPFIEKYKSLEEQYIALQFEPLKKNVLSMWPAERLMKSIILAKIIGKTDWPLLFSKYEPLFNEVFKNDSKEEFYELRKLMLGH